MWQHFFSFRAPQQRKIAIFRFRTKPRISLRANSRPRPKSYQLFLPLPASWGPVSQNGTCEKVADNHPGQYGNFFFPVSGALAPGNCVFLFLAGARNFSKCLRPKWAKNPINHRFRPVGFQPKNKLSPRQLRKTIPDSMVTFFFRSWDPCCSADQKGPC